MPLGMKLRLGPVNIVLDGDPAHPPLSKKGHRTPNFCLCLLWPNGRPSQLLLSTCLAISCLEYLQLQMDKLSKHEIVYFSLMRNCSLWLSLELTNRSGARFTKYLTIYHKLIARSTYDSDLQCAKIYRTIIVS